MQNHEMLLQDQCAQLEDGCTLFRIFRIRLETGLSKAEWFISNNNAIKRVLRFGHAQLSE